MQTLGEQIPYLGPWTVWPSEKEARRLHDLLGNTRKPGVLQCPCLVRLILVLVHVKCQGLICVTYY